MKKLLFCAIAAIFLMSLFAVSDSLAMGGKKGPNWGYKGVTVEENLPGVKHYVWEIARPPYGPFDKIALHRFVYEPLNLMAIPGLPPRDKRKVLFIIPGTWDSGSPKGSDPNFAENYFFAANGYDVYSMDFRTSYVTNLAYDQFAANGIDVSPTGDWTYGVFREDIKTCVDKAKDISRTKKLFMAGRSRGGTQLFIYASKYWQEDLKGLISLDGGGKITPPSGNKMTQAAYQIAVNLFKQGMLPPPLNVFLTEVSGYEQAQFAGAVPFAKTAVGYDLAADAPLPAGPPPDGSAIETVSDYVAYGAYWAWGAGKVTNYYTPYPGGSGETYMYQDVLINIESNFTRYWPAIQDLEGSQLTAYSGSGCPFLDYDDNLANLPMIAFFSELFCPGGLCLYLPGNMTLSADVTFKYLKGYGHLDVYSGTHSLEDVKQPMLEWMNDRLK
jgi:hypothetical protein